ncbi:MAG: 5'-3' exonuclease H3TH domain-containing protein [bacterium]|nr:MAG: 5'-3' exonuclease H3TH domain-containing protein [bacterium]
MSKLVIFDGNAIMYRAFHALPPLTSKSGEQINALYGLVSMLINIVENLKPTHIIFCFDEKEKTFRNELLPTYQSQRPEIPSELIPQFKKARDFLKSVNIPVYSKSGYEADDVIGTITKLVVTSFPLINETVIVTGDRDILQLVDDKNNIKLFMPIAGLSNGKIFAEKETIERLGVPPTKIPDYKALVGDPSDNYFGIPGIGPKTATSLLTEYETLDGIYEHIDEVPEKLREKLIDGKESAYLSYKLATIVKNVPIKIDIETSNNFDLVSENVLKLFEEYGFKTLTARIKKLGEQIEKEKQGSLF